MKSPEGEYTKCWKTAQNVFVNVLLSNWEGISRDLSWPDTTGLDSPRKSMLKKTAGDTMLGALLSTVEDRVTIHNSFD